MSAGQEVLDNAAGDGNFAVICAEEGASVVAADIAPGMVAAGRERSAAEGVDIEWLEGDAEELPFDDARFDCVGSVFGAMIAPRPRVAAEEMFRVVKPGGTVGMTAWVPRGSDLRDVPASAASYAPQTRAGRGGAALLEEWSREEVVRERFDGLAGSIEVSRRSMPWRGRVARGVRRGDGALLPRCRWPRWRRCRPTSTRMREEMVQMAREWAGGDGPFEAEGEYAVIVARRPG